MLHAKFVALGFPERNQIAARAVTIAALCAGLASCSLQPMPRDVASREATDGGVAQEPSFDAAEDSARVGDVWSVEGTATDEPMNTNDEGFEDTGAEDAGNKDTSGCVVWDPKGRQSLVIESAKFGVGNSWTDGTAKFQSFVRNNWLYYHVYRTYIDLGDPAPKQNKELQLKYRIGSTQHKHTYQEGQIIYINVPTQNTSCCNWQLLSASFGPNESSAIDVTNKLKHYILDCKLDFYCFSSNELAGDPAPGADKQLYITYQYNGSTKKFVCHEEGANNRILIP